MRPAGQLLVTIDLLAKDPGGIWSLYQRPGIFYPLRVLIKSLVRAAGPERYPVPRIAVDRENEEASFARPPVAAYLPIPPEIRLQEPRSGRRYQLPCQPPVDQRYR